MKVFKTRITDEVLKTGATDKGVEDGRNS